MGKARERRKEKERKGEEKQSSGIFGRKAVSPDSKVRHSPRESAESKGRDFKKKKGGGYECAIEGRRAVQGKG